MAGCRIGGVAVDTDWIDEQLDKVTDRHWDVVLLASDSEVTAQELARLGGVWAPPPRTAGPEPPADVWVSLGTGAVAVGTGSLTADGRLQISPVPLRYYPPRAVGGSTGQGAAARDQAVLSPVRTLTQAQALADPGPWQRRTASAPADPLPEPTAEALARYGRALQVLSGAEAALAEYDARPGGPAGLSPVRQELLGAVSDAGQGLAQAGPELADLGVDDPEGAWQQIATHLSARSGGGLPGGAPLAGKGGRGNEEGDVEPGPEQLPWLPGSWEDVHGRAMVAGAASLRLAANAATISGLFVMGLHVGPDGLMSLYGVGEDFSVPAGSPEPSQLRALGWDGHQAIAVVTQRRARDDLESRLEQLGAALGTDIWYPSAGARLELNGSVLKTVDAEGEVADLWQLRWSESLLRSGSLTFAAGFSRIGFPQGQASMRPAEFAERRHLLAREPEPGLFDLLPQLDDGGALALVGRDGHLAVLDPRELPIRPGEAHEVRLVMDDGERARGAAAALAAALRMPVWLTPAGAVAEVSQEGRLIARRAGEPVSWVQVLPFDPPAAGLPWYDTTSGLFQTRPGGPAIELRRGDQVYGVMAVGHPQYSYIRRLAARSPRVPAGLYVAMVVVGSGPGGPVFLVPDFSGDMATRPLTDLPGYLEGRGWSPGQDIVVVADFSFYGNPLAAGVWASLTDGFARIALQRGVSVYFPGRGSRADFLHANLEPTVTGGADPRWERRDPPGRAAQFVQDDAGRLQWSREGFVSVALAAAGLPALDDDAERALLEQARRARADAVQSHANESAIWREGQEEYSRRITAGRAAAAMRHLLAVRTGMGEREAQRLREEQLYSVQDSALAVRDKAWQRAKEEAAGPAERAYQQVFDRFLVRRLRQALAARPSPGQASLRDQLEQARDRVRHLEETIVAPMSERLAAAAANRERAAEQEARTAARQRADEARLQAEDRGRGFGLSRVRIARRGQEAADEVLRRAEDQLSGRLEDIRRRPEDPRVVLGSTDYSLWKEAKAESAQAKERVGRLRARLAEEAVAASKSVLAGGDSVASVYAWLIRDAMLPPGWIADLGVPAGLWVRPQDDPAAELAAERTRVNALPASPAAGLIVVGMTGRAVPPQAWQAVRRALEQVPGPERAALRVRAIDTTPSAGNLAGLVVVEEILAGEPPAQAVQAPVTPLILSRPDPVTAWKHEPDEHGGMQWKLDPPDAQVLELPPALVRGHASGQGNRCLLDSLRQLLGGDTTAEGLRDRLLELLPPDDDLRPENQVRRHLGDDDMVDIWQVLPELTAAYQFRLQAFQHVEDPGDPGWRGRQAILPSPLTGPPTDTHGNPTPIVQLYWRGRHFDPLFAGPTAPAAALGVPESTAVGLPAPEHRGPTLLSGDQAADQALAYLSGDPAVRLDAGAQRELVTALVTGPVSEDERWLALQLLRAASDADLRDITDAGRNCWRCWRRTSRPGTAAPGAGVLAGGGSGRAGLAGNPDRAARAACGPFTPALFDRSLNLALDVEPTARPSAASRLPSASASPAGGPGSSAGRLTGLRWCSGPARPGG